jgi:hypothetical protein
LPQPILDGHALTDQGAAVSLRQGHPFAQLAAQNLVFLAEEVVLLGQILAEELLDPSDERSGSAAKSGFHSVKVTGRNID